MRSYPSDGWAGRWLAAPGNRLTVLTGVLVLLAGTEVIARTTGTGIDVRLAVTIWLLALFVPLALAVPHPVTAAIVVSAASVLSLAIFHILTIAGLAAQLIALYRLGRNRGAPLLAAGLAVPFLVLALAGPRPTSSEAALLTVLLAVATPLAAWAGFARRARGAELAHHATRQDIAGSLVEHTARGERARIARELHDVVAHHISMIAVQAETARLTTPGLPSVGAQRLSEIGDTARAGLTEMRRLLSVLRADAGTDAAERRPQPSLQQLNALLDEAREVSGAVTRLIVSGRPVPLDPGVELAAYRIVQEALTNARRHAPGAAADVELRYTDDALRLRIRDNGPGPPAVSRAGGHGLLGMRERAAAVGGELRTGPATGGGFLVEARLPVEGAT